MQKLVAIATLLSLSALPAYAANIVVEPGDSLSRIALQELGDSDKWQDICAANSETLAGDCDRLYPGTTLVIPGDGAATAPVKPGPIQSQAETAPVLQVEAAPVPLAVSVIPAEGFELSNEGSGMVATAVANSETYRLRYGFTADARTKAAVHWSAQLSPDATLIVFTQKRQVIATVRSLGDEPTTKGAIAALTVSDSNGISEVSFDLELQSDDGFVQLLLYPFGEQASAVPTNANVRFSEPTVD